MGCKEKFSRISVFFLFLQRHPYGSKKVKAAWSCSKGKSRIRDRERSVFSTTVRNFVDKPIFFFHKFLIFLTNPFFPHCTL